MTWRSCFKLPGKRINVVPGLKVFFFNFRPHLGWCSQLTHMLQEGWNHQPELFKLFQLLLQFVFFPVEASDFLLPAAIDAISRLQCLIQLGGSSPRKWPSICSLLNYCHPAREAKTPRNSYRLALFLLSASHEPWQVIAGDLPTWSNSQRWLTPKHQWGGSPNIWMHHIATCSENSMAMNQNPGALGTLK